MQRRVGCRGALVVVGQRTHVGIRHAGATLTVEAADTAFRIHDSEGAGQRSSASIVLRGAPVAARLCEWHP